MSRPKGPIRLPLTRLVPQDYAREGLADPPEAAIYLVWVKCLSCGLEAAIYTWYRDWLQSRRKRIVCWECGQDEGSGRFFVRRYRLPHVEIAARPGLVAARPDGPPADAFLGPAEP